MTYVDNFALSSVPNLDRCAEDILNTDEPNLTLRQQARLLYMQAFERACLSNEQILPGVIPVYKSHLKAFLELVANTDLHAKNRLDTLTESVRLPLAQLHAATEWKKAYRKISPDFSQAAEIISAARNHLDLPGTLEQLVKIAENEKQICAIRREAIITFKEVATNAATTFGYNINRGDYNPRFEAIMFSTKEIPLINAALRYGYKYEF